MAPSTSGDPHPEVERWLEMALKQDWHPSAKPKIEGGVLRIPHAYFDWGATEPKEIEWVAVKSREDLLKALGYGPIFD